MIWIVRALLAASTVFTVVFEPRVFFGSGPGGGWISFASWFYDGSWWAFRLAIAALVLWTIVVATTGAGVRSSWREPAVALVLIAWAFVRGVPHRENVSSWARGEVGALAWLRAERSARDEREIPIGPEVFAGRWVAADGTTWEFAPNEARRVVPDSAARSEAATRARCSAGFRVVYLERGRDVFVERGVDSSAHALAVLATLSPRARVAVASVACADEPWSAEFVRVGDEVWLFEPWMTNAEMRADAFVLRRGG
jgi:hypothetical protein